MDTKPQRRWFQFRLSTWLVLIAIAAWTMATPFWFCQHVVDTWRNPQPPPSLHVSIMYFSTRNGAVYKWLFTFFDLWKLTPPAAALLGLFAWKLARRWMERRRSAESAGI